VREGDSDRRHPGGWGVFQGPPFFCLGNGDPARIAIMVNFIHTMGARAGRQRLPIPWDLFHALNWQACTVDAQVEKKKKRG
jgi:hypothetical protein